MGRSRREEVDTEGTGSMDPLKTPKVSNCFFMTVFTAFFEAHGTLRKRHRTIKVSKGAKIRNRYN